MYDREMFLHFKYTHLLDYIYLLLLINYVNYHLARIDSTIFSFFIISNYRIFHYQTF